MALLPISKVGLARPALVRTARAASLALVLTGFAATAEAGCDAFPDVSWWQGLTHGKTIRYVLRDLNGDWERHLRHFEAVREKLGEIRADGGIAVVSGKGIRLKGAALKEYIENVDERIEIIRCLSKYYRDSYFRGPRQ